MSKAVELARDAELQSLRMQLILVEQCQRSIFIGPLRRHEYREQARELRGRICNLEFSHMAGDGGGR